MFHKLFYNCHDASLNAIRKEGKSVGLITRLRLWCHLKACAACRNFDRQNAKINHLVDKMKAAPKAEASIESKERWKSLLTPHEKGS